MKQFLSVIAINSIIFGTISGIMTLWSLAETLTTWKVVSNFFRNKQGLKR